MQITVGLLQMVSCGEDQDANLAKGEAFCRRAQAMGADIALFPEMWNIGYSNFCQQGMPEIWRAPELWGAEYPPAPSILEEARKRWQAQAIGRDSSFITHFRELARELDMAIALTYLEKWNKGDRIPRNSMSLIDRHSEIVMTYAKVHTCDFDMPEAACTPGDDFYVCVLDTRKGEVQVGAMICYDREFPESARILMLKGAELILTSNACELEANRIAQFRVRAYENALALAMANYAAPQENGHSVAFDPIAFDEHGRTRDTLVIEAGESEGVYLASFDMNKIRDYRKREAWGDAFRRPHRYGMLTSLEVREPFVRVNADGEQYDRARR